MNGCRISWRPGSYITFSSIPMNPTQLAISLCLGTTVPVGRFRLLPVIMTVIANWDRDAMNSANATAQSEPATNLWR